MLIKSMSLKSFFSFWVKRTFGTFQKPKVMDRINHPRIVGGHAWKNNINLIINYTNFDNHIIVFYWLPFLLWTHWFHILVINQGPLITDCFRGPWIIKLKLSIINFWWLVCTCSNDLSIRIWNMYSRVWNKCTPLNKHSPWKIWKEE